MKSLREEFASTALDIAKKDKNVVVIVGDISHGLFKPYAKKFSNRYFNIGICEPSMVNLASGLSKIGFTPLVHTIAPFLIERSYEQIKLDFGYQNENINLISVGGSFDYSQLGCSHHCYNDVSLMSHLKRSNIVIPGSPLEFNVIFKKIYKKKMINYFRLTENQHGISIPKSEIVFGKGIKIQNGKDITIATIAPQLNEVLKAASKLKEIGINAEILYFHTFKPFDGRLLNDSVRKTKKILCVEELSKHGGLFNQCVINLLGQDKLKFCQLAVNDFVYGYGSHIDLMKKAGIAQNDIFNGAIKLLRD